MKDRPYKKFVLFFMAAIMMVTIFSPSSLVYGAPVERSIYDDVTEISDKSTILSRGNYLNYGAVTLTKLDSMKIRISGETAAHRVCDTLVVDLYLYRSKDGERYENYRDWSFKKQNGSYFWKVLEVIVPSGYYYAIGGNHMAFYNGDGESTTTFAAGLWVN
ncbi:MAG: hypothetical protein HFH57_07185 [Lachnospiraceae bacterium]|nr:hypothetical protein [Lachnospiraceae bacterium]